MFEIQGLLAPRYAQRLLSHWERHPGFGLSSDGGTPPGRPLACAVAHRPVATRPEAPEQAPLLRALGQRADATANFIRTGGRLGSVGDDPVQLQARTNYFRATYARGPFIWAPVVCRLLNHPVLADAARQLFDRPVVVPTEIYANVMLPGQELGLHTDVPQFRGATRDRYPLWFLVVMQQSGLFQRWRTHLATAVLHLGTETAPGGAFTYYPAGADAEPVSMPTRHNTALLLDTDTTLHGVDRIGGAVTAPRLPAGTRLRHTDGRWRLSIRDDATDSPAWTSNELRYSISWKAQCFADVAERRITNAHTDDLSYDTIVNRLLASLPQGSAELPPVELGRLLIDTFVRFPAAVS
jgi:hypothetical protein